MKKVLIGLIAAAMLLGSFAKAEEVSDWDREHGEAQIQTGMINGMEQMVSEIRSLKADSHAVQNNAKKNQLEALASSAELVIQATPEDGRAVDASYLTVLTLRNTACQVVAKRCQ